MVSSAPEPFTFRCCGVIPIPVGHRVQAVVLEYGGAPMFDRAIVTELESGIEYGQTAFLQNVGSASALALGVREHARLTGPAAAPYR